MIYKKLFTQFILVSLCGKLVPGHKMKAKNGQWTVDGYCFQKLPKYPKEGPDLNLGTRNFINICSNVKMFSQCLVNTRKNVPPGVFVQPYEKEFPSEYDLFRAGYEFCYSYMPAVFEVLVDRAETIRKAEEEMVQNQDCNNTPTVQLVNLAQQHLDVKSPEYKTTACNCFVDYYKCWDDTYSNRIFGRIEWMHVYYFARLGGQCLISRNVTNDIVTQYVICAPAPSISRAGPLEHDAPLGILPAAALIIAYFVEALTFTRP